ncbi:MAG: Nif11-like leader peptide family natural product precursor [Chlorobiaceae bacterium]|nr:Nif11-like leader peptide family natural product precursor [Chlorobiaceae bacterium]
MSIEHAKAFIEKMKTEEVFRDRIMAIENPEARMAAINSEGFVFTPQELDEQEDFDCQLTQVVGGTCWAFSGTTCFSVGNNCWVVNPNYCSMVG